MTTYYQRPADMPGQAGQNSRKPVPMLESDSHKLRNAAGTSKGIRL